MESGSMHVITLPKILIAACFLFVIGSETQFLNGQETPAPSEDEAQIAILAAAAKAPAQISLNDLPIGSTPTKLARLMKREVKTVKVTPNTYATFVQVFNVVKVCSSKPLSKQVHLIDTLSKMAVQNRGDHPERPAQPPGLSRYLKATESIPLDEIPVSLFASRGKLYSFSKGKSRRPSSLERNESATKKRETEEEVLDRLKQLVVQEVLPRREAKLKYRVVLYVDADLSFGSLAEIINLFMGKLRLDKSFDRYANTIELHTLTRPGYPEEYLTLELYPGLFSARHHILPRGTTSGAPAIAANTGGPNSTATANGTAGTNQAQSSVDEGLKWLISVQMQDGSWNFRTIGLNTQPGSLANTALSTGLVLLTFLEAGHTLQESPYKENLEKALNFLADNAGKSRVGLDLRGPSSSVVLLDSQSICTEVLCRFLAQLSNKDKMYRTLRTAATGAVKFVIASQDPKTGGWIPHGERRSYTVTTGWHLRALKAAEQIKIKIPVKTYNGIKVYLKSVSRDGARYAYRESSTYAEDESSVMGLLSSVALGVPKDNPAILSGVQYLITDEYYYYYLWKNYALSELLALEGGDLWKNWRTKVYPDLMARQVKSGPSKGSFSISSRYDNSGGRIYNTCLCLMILSMEQQLQNEQQKEEKADPETSTDSTEKTPAESSTKDSSTTTPTTVPKEEL